jgi:uncharacterized OB-fold protein
VSEGITVYVCGSCSRPVFPARLLCPRCGSREWERVSVQQGTILATTSTRKRVIVERLIETRIAEVRTDAGPIVVARLHATGEPGEKVRLATRAGGIVAEPLEV